MELLVNGRNAALRLQMGSRKTCNNLMVTQLKRKANDEDAKNRVKTKTVMNLVDAKRSCL